MEFKAPKIQMTSDNRTVFTDALKTLGTHHKVEEGTRDAIHIAGRVCRAAQILAPGQRVARLQDGRYGVPATGDKILGIVDPFLHSFIAEDEVFWLMLFPRTITALRHEWEHPDFPKEDAFEVRPAYAAPVPVEISAELQKPEFSLVAKIIEAAVWLESFWPQIDCDSHEHMMQIADDFVESGEHLVEGGRWENARSVMWEHHDKFWDSYELVKGVELTADQRGSIFCCTC